MSRRRASTTICSAASTTPAWTRSHWSTRQHTYRETIGRINEFAPGPNVMGDLGNDEATAETLDDDAWLHTGDLARVDSYGCVYIVDRLKELIKYKGYSAKGVRGQAISAPGCPQTR